MYILCATRHPQWPIVQKIIQFLQKWSMNVNLNWIETIGKCLFVISSGEQLINLQFNPLFDCWLKFKEYNDRKKCVLSSTESIKKHTQLQWRWQRRRRRQRRREKTR